MVCTFIKQEGGNCTHRSEHIGIATSADEPPWVQLKPNSVSCFSLNTLWVIKSWEPDSVSGTQVLESKIRSWCNKWKKIQTLEVSEIPRMCHRAKLLLAYSMPCLPYFTLIYAQLLNSKEKKQTCPISYYTTVRGLGACQEDGICWFQAPLAQNPSLPLHSKVLFVPDNTSVLRTGLSECHTQGVLPTVGSVQTPLLSHLPQMQPSTERGVVLSRKSDKDQRQGLTDSAQTWEHLFRHGMLKSQLQ